METSGGSIMDAAAVATIGALTTTLCQIIKRSLPGDWDKYGPLFAAEISLAGVVLWVYSAPVFPPARTDVWTLAAGWVAVFATSAGIYETAKMATHKAAIPPTREDVAEPHEHLDTPAPEAQPELPDRGYRPPPAPEASAASAPRGAVLTEPVVATPVPRRPRPRPTVEDAP
jgi:hypothetical protein